MKILAFDTTNSTASVAVSDDERVISYIEELRPSMQAERLVTMVEEALLSAKLTYQDIDCLAVTNGPGSFTGIRIGLAAATGILLGLNERVIFTSVTNFEIAHFRSMSQIRHYDQAIILLNAYRNQLYVQLFKKGEIVSSQPVLLNYAQTIELISKQKGNSVCAGSGVSFIYEGIQSMESISVLPRFTRVKAIDLCRYVSRTISTRELQPIAPMYIISPDAIIPSVKSSD